MLLEYADITADGSGIRSAVYGDIYYNPEHGRRETEYVFIHGNNLAQRFAALADGANFTIGETGFGSGLNFIAAAAAFLAHAPRHAHLSYLSCEKHPIRLETLKKLQQHWELPELRHNLYRHYPHNHQGWHLLKPHPRISLLLLLDDANNSLPALHAQVDAWFLDGFAPAKNTSLWSPAVLQAIAANSTKHTTLATFTAARNVKDGLAAAGFSLQKTAGFGRKRDMLIGRYTGLPRLPHWSDPPPPLPYGAKVAIIGAGLAGASTAAALHQAGFSVQLIHSANYPAASAVPAAIPYLQPSIDNTPMRRYHLASWHHTLRALAELPPHIQHPAPIHLQLPEGRAAALHAQQLLNPEQYTYKDSNLTLHQAGILNTPALLKHLLNPIPTLTHTVTPTEIQNQYINGEHYHAIILCTAWQTSLLPDAWRSQLSPLRGQALIQHSTTPPPLGAYCGRHSILSCPNHIYIGSTYQPNCADTDIRPLDRDSLAKAYCDAFPEYPAAYQSDFTGIRASTRDYFPLLGGLPDEVSLKNHYARWRKNAKQPIHVSPEYPSPLYLNAGLGSKGSLLCWLNADCLTAQLTGRPLPLPTNLYQFLSPARIIIKNIIRNR